MKQFISVIFSCIFLFGFLGQIKSQNSNSIINPNFKPSVKEQISEEGFVHPGIVLSASELNLIQEMVRQGYEPWTTAFEKFRTESKASKTYIIQNKDEKGIVKYKVMGDGNGQYEARRDADAAFAQTIMWYITGDMDYANKALEIIRLWSSSIVEPTRDMLTGGMVVQKFCFAAEVLKYTPNSGWTEKDNENFSSFLNIMKPSVDKPTAFMNQGGIATMGYISTAVFLNNLNMYQTAILRATVGKESKAPLRDYSIKNQIREVINPENGQPQLILLEMGRDQGHAQGDIGALGSIAQTSFIQKTKVNGDGEIDKNGVDLFSFLDNRLLKGAVLTAKYNMGYDIVYPPTNVGTIERPEIYQDVSGDMRGQLAPVYELIYNHYRYEKGLSDSDENLKIIKAVLNYSSPETSNTDFFGSGTLFFTNSKAILKAKLPKGEPKPFVVENYKDKANLFQRFQASDFSGSKGDKTGDVNLEYFTDSEGTRRVASGIKTNFFTWYKNFDFGSVPVNDMIINAGSAGVNGCKMDVILLDNVKNINFDKVTDADLDAGEKIAIVTIPATGWWSNFVITSAHFTNKLSGKHSFALRYYGSGHVYRFQANVDWFKFANSYSGAINTMDKADVLLNGAVSELDGSVKLKDNSTVIFKNMDIDNGLGLLHSTLNATGDGVIEIRKGTANGLIMASYSIVSTNGKWIDYRSLSNVQSTCFGKQDLYLIYKGKGKLQLKTFQNISLKQDFKAVKSTEISIVFKGKAEFKTDFASITALKEGTTVVFPQVQFKNGPKFIAFKIRSSSEASLSLINVNKKSKRTDEPFLTITIPNTNGKWQILHVDMAQASKKLTSQQMIYMTIQGNGGLFDFAEMQFDPVMLSTISK